MRNEKMPHTFLFLFLSALLQTSASSSFTTDYETLVAIKTEWGNPPQLASWKSTDYCSWTGVSCVAGGVVTGLSFKNLNLTGSVPASVCGLKRLLHLDLSLNNLTGAFPGAALYACTELQFLDFSNNALDGVLPADIGRLSPLLTELNLTANNFSGLLPTAIGELRALKSLLVDANKFTGQIPESYSSLKELNMLDMSANELSGAVPLWIWQHQKLERLYLFQNELTGELPSNVTAVNLVEMDLSSNKLNGSIPEGFGTLKNLTKLLLYFNQFSGRIPTGIGHLPNLQYIQLYDNMLSGELPPELGKHSPLAIFEVPNNHLSGSLPDQLCAHGTLFSIVVFNNSLSGELPASIGNCLPLETIMISSNNFSGEFPARIWSLPHLGTVMISKNKFTGALPSALPQNISRIEMGHNLFSGSFPTSAPGLLVFKAESNQLSGELPANMSMLGNLIDASVSGNSISGSIPSSITSLQKLNSLNLSDNRISGVIPPLSIGLLPSLGLLDLSGNELTGEIPADFGNLNFGTLNLSCNNLTGEVPASLQIAVYERSFLGNPGLCAKQGIKVNLPACGHASSTGSGGHHDKPSTKLIIPLSILSVIIICIIVAVGAWWMLLRPQRRPEDSPDVANSVVLFSALNFTESDIINNIGDDNLIGVGGCGKVYRVQLPSRGIGEQATVVAVKKIGSQGRSQENLNKQFESEANVLGNIRHRNIVRLLGYISTHDVKLLVYEYVVKGSLDSLLHQHGQREGVPVPLDWPKRLGIALDVAMGLSYMHTDHEQPIIHRDIKLANVLIDSDFQAKIADFGLARMLEKPGESEGVSAVGGTYGYVAPEYLTRQRVSEKIDVYSFGVILLELTTGKVALERGADITLAGWARQQRLLNEDVIDQRLHDPPCNLPKIVTVFKLGVYCTCEDPLARPTMKEVLYQLERVNTAASAETEAAP